MLLQQFQVQRLGQEAEYLRLIDQVDHQFRVRGLGHHDGEDFRVVLLQQLEGGQRFLVAVADVGDDHCDLMLLQHGQGAVNVRRMQYRAHAAD